MSKTNGFPENKNSEKKLVVKVKEQAIKAAFLGAILIANAVFWAKISASTCHPCGPDNASLMDVIRFLLVLTSTIGCVIAFAVAIVFFMEGDESKE